MNTPSKSVIETFFNAFSTGDTELLVSTFHDDVEITAQGPTTVPWYGTYHGKQGLSDFLSQLGSNAETQAFSVDNIVAEEKLVFAYGHLKHRIVTTGKMFESDWVLRSEVAESKIIAFKFFEDSAAAQTAFVTDDL